MRTVLLRALSFSGSLALAVASACSPAANSHDAGDGPHDATTMDTPVADAPAPDAADDVDAGPLPNITVDPGYLSQDVQFAMQYFQGDSCELQEQCVSGPGWRRLMMFTTFTPNIGDADLDLGASSPTNPNFMYSTCHMHYHFLGYADYELVDSTGRTSAIGHKQSFCVEDLEQVDHSPGISPDARYDNCGEGMTGEQGIQRGWADEYYPNLPCQWIDVTDVKPGDYTLRVTLNSMHRFAESDYTDNTVEVPVTVPSDWSAGASGSATDPTRHCRPTDPEQGIGRDCGWTVEGTHTCTPGEHVRVGCSDACGLGTCDGDSLLRICEGGQPCRGGDAMHVLQQDYGECSTGVYRLNALNCPLAAFDCPASGTYTVLKAPDYVGDGATCNVQIERGSTSDGGAGDASASDAGPADASGADAAAD